MVDKVIGLYGVPRSGTSWLGQIFDSCENVVFKFQPLFSYAFKNYIVSGMEKTQIQEFFEKLIIREDDFLDQTRHREEGIYPNFNKNLKRNILVYKEANYLYSIPIILKEIKDIKMVAIIRNPYDVMESWINAPAEFNPDWDLNKEWQFAQSKNCFQAENFFGYNKWKEAVKMFCEMERLYPENFSLVQYENLCNDVIKETGRMFEFVGLNFSKQTEKFIIDSQMRTIDSVYSVYKAKNEKKKRKIILPNDIKDIIKKDLFDFEEAYRFGYIK